MVSLMDWVALQHQELKGNCRIAVEKNKLGDLAVLLEALVCIVYFDTVS